MNENSPQIVKYQTKDGKIELDIRFQEDNTWLTQSQMSDLFTKNKRTISEHINNIFKEGELKEKLAIRNIRISAHDGKVYKTNHYNFDVIISVGYRVKSSQITPFRYWVEDQLKKTIKKGSDKGINKKEILKSLNEIIEDIDNISLQLKSTTF